MSSSLVFGSSQSNYEGDLEIFTVMTKEFRKKAKEDIDKLES